MTNKVFTVILSAYVEGLAASVKASRERLPGSPVSLLFSDLMAKIFNASPVHRLLSNGTDNNVSQKETSRAHVTDGLLAHRLILVLVNRLNNGNSRMSLPCNV